MESFQNELQLQFCKGDEQLYLLPTAYVWLMHLSFSLSFQFQFQKKSSLCVANCVVQLIQLICWLCFFFKQKTQFVNKLTVLHSMVANFIFNFQTFQAIPP